MRVLLPRACLSALLLIAWSVPAVAQFPSQTQILTVSSTSVGLSAATLSNTALQQATACILTVEGDSIRVRYDGTAPTASVGHLFTNPSVFQVTGTEELRALRMIRVTTDATVTATCSYGPLIPALTTAAAGGSSGSSGGGDFDAADFNAAFGTAGSADSQVLTVQGIASGTAVIVGDGSGALNTIVDSGTITAVTTITNAVTVTDGSGALNVIVDSGALTVNTTTDGTAFSSGSTALFTSGFRRDDSTLDGIGAGCAAGDICTAAMSAVGSVAVSLYNPTTGAIISLATDSTFGTTTYTETTNTGPLVGAIRNDTLDALANTNNEVAPIQVDAVGQLWTRNSDPCQQQTKLYLPINISTATTTEITPSLAGSSTHYYVCSLVLVTAAANNVALADDNTDGCGSVTAGLAGGTTAASGWNFAANGGLTLGNGMGAVMRTVTTNAVLCLVTSAATQLSGHMVVAAAP